jgi:hypothetical protein
MHIVDRHTERVLRHPGVFLVQTLKAFRANQGRIFSRIEM